MTLMKPKAVDELPTGDKIIYELKYDGGSSVVVAKDKNPIVFHGDDVVPQNYKYPEIAEELKTKVKDGFEYVVEICVINYKYPGGDIDLYHKRMCKDPFKIQRRAKLNPITFVFHDVIIDDMPLFERKKILAENVKPSEHIKLIRSYTTPEPILELHTKFDTVEGLVAKDLDSLYRMDSRIGWWKKRFNVEQTVKVVEYEPWTKEDGTPGIVMITDDGKRITLAGPRQEEAKEKINAEGFAMVEIVFHKVSDKGFRFTTVKRVL